MRTFNSDPKIPKPNFSQVYSYVSIDGKHYIGQFSFRETMKMANHLLTSFKIRKKNIKITQSAVAPYYEIKVDNTTIYLGTMEWWWESINKI